MRNKTIQSRAYYHAGAEIRSMPNDRQYEREFWFTGQLFEKDWKPRFPYPESIPADPNPSTY